jgi:hypothetical protein
MSKKKWANRPNPWLRTSGFEGQVKEYYENLAKHFRRFGRNVFVETGTHLGNGLQCALNTGHSKCYTIEIHEYLYRDARQRFHEQIGTGQVECFWGDSAKVLPGIVAELTEPALFWIDAHISGNYGDKIAEKNCPIYEELEAIAASAIRTHTLMIDDLACFDKPVHDNIPLQAVQERIRRINPAYRFEYLDSHLPGNIMVAYIE